MRNSAGGSRNPGVRWSLAAALALAGLVLMSPALASASAPTAPPVLATVAGSPVFLNVSTTESISFAPNVLSVEPGQSVHLVVTQLADFNHTFTLSPLANFTFPSTDSTADLDAFLATHTPLVNLSLGSTMGTKFYANFTAPPMGTYEYVCLEKDHFGQGMHGELDSGITTSASASSSPYVLYAAAVAAGAIVVVAIAALVMRRRKTPPG